MVPKLREAEPLTLYAARSIEYGALMLRRGLHVGVFLVMVLFVTGIFAEIAGKIAGRKICREAPGPEDTLQFELVLHTDGTIKGSGSLSGALGIVYFQNGSWRLKDGRVFAKINLAGKMTSGQKMEKSRRTIQFDFPATELVAAKKCYEPQIAQ